MLDVLYKIILHYEPRNEAVVLLNRSLPFSFVKYHFTHWGIVNAQYLFLAFPDFPLHGAECPLESKHWRNVVNQAARQCSVSLIYRRVFKPLIPNLPPCYMHLFSLKAKAPCPFQLIPAGTLRRNVVSLTQRGGSVVPIRPGRSLGNIVVRGNKYDPLSNWTVRRHHSIAFLDPTCRISRDQAQPAENASQEAASKQICLAALIILLMITSTYMIWIILAFRTSEDFCIIFASQEASSK